MQSALPRKIILQQRQNNFFGQTNDELLCHQHIQTIKNIISFNLLKDLRFFSKMILGK